MLASNPFVMYQPDQRATVVHAVERIQARFAQLAPLMGARIQPWMAALAGGAHPADYYLHPRSFPMFLLPWWCAQTCGGAPDLTLQQDSAYVIATLYYSIRILDDVMDGDKKTPAAMLPAVNFLLTESQRPLQKYFAHDHPFWQAFDRIWAQSSEVAVEDAVAGALDEATFYQFAGKKTQAGNIPIAIVCHHYGRPDLIEPWHHFLTQFCYWHQMQDDVFDWHKDSRSGANTYFLSEAQRRMGADETLVDWVMRAGFAWADLTLQAWMTRTQAAARALACPALDAYLDDRVTQFAQQAAEIQRDLPALRALWAALNTPQKAKPA